MLLLELLNLSQLSHLGGKIYIHCIFCGYEKAGTTLCVVVPAFSLLDGLL